MHLNIRRARILWAPPTKAACTMQHAEPSEEVAGYAGPDATAPCTEDMNKLIVVEVVNKTRVLFYALAVAVFLALGCLGWKKVATVFAAKCNMFKFLVWCCIYVFSVSISLAHGCLGWERAMPVADAKGGIIKDDLPPLEEVD